MELFLVAIFSSFLHHVYGSNILAVMPFPTFSHTNAYLPLLKELARKGHNVTMVSPFPQKEPIPNFNDIALENTLLNVRNAAGLPRDIRQFSLFLKFTGIWPICSSFLDPVFNMPRFQELLKDRHSKFDLVIIEAFFCQQPLLAFAHKYGASVVAIVTTYISPGISVISGNSYPMAYVPNMNLVLTDHMTFWERVQNTFISILEILVDELIGERIMDNYIRNNLKIYPGFENVPPVSEMLNNISLFLVDNHLSLNYPRPYLPNVIDFGGLSVKSGGKLPSDLEKFMSESKEGVIFFTWGSHYEMTNMPPKLLLNFMSIFGKLKERVLMKWENETLPGKPENVKIAKWFPQASILSHPKTRLFITHGGIHGMTEAVFNGVPVLGTALFADQFYNLKMAENSGMALNIDVDRVTEEQLSIAIDRLLHDPKFKESAKKKSMIFKDRPLSALDNAVYWVEYVLRHNGAHHLRPASLDLTWYQNWLLDVVALFIAIIIGLAALFVYSVKYLYKKCKKNKSDKSEQKNKKK